MRAEAAAFFARFLAADLEMLGAGVLGWEDIRAVSQCDIRVFEGGQVGSYDQRDRKLTYVRPTRFDLTSVSLRCSNEQCLRDKGGRM